MRTQRNSAWGTHESAAVTGTKSQKALAGREGGERAGEGQAQTGPRLVLDGKKFNFIPSFLESQGRLWMLPYMPRGEDWREGCPRA